MHRLPQRRSRHGLGHRVFQGGSDGSDGPQIPSPGPVRPIPKTTSSPSKVRAWACRQTSWHPLRARFTWVYNMQMGVFGSRKAHTHTGSPLHTASGLLVHIRVCGCWRGGPPQENGLGKLVRRLPPAIDGARPRPPTRFVCLYLHKTESANMPSKVFYESTDTFPWCQGFPDGGCILWYCLLCSEL